MSHTQTSTQPRKLRYSTLSDMPDEPQDAYPSSLDGIAGWLTAKGNEPKPVVLTHLLDADDYPTLATANDAALHVGDFVKVIRAFTHKIHVTRADDKSIEAQYGPWQKIAIKRAKHLEAVNGGDWLELPPESAGDLD